jgi:hypothetical protein
MDERPHMSGSKCATSATPFGAGVASVSIPELITGTRLRDLLFRGLFRVVINSGRARAFLHGNFAHRRTGYAGGTYVNAGRASQVGWKELRSAPDPSGSRCVQMCVPAPAAPS